MKAKRIIAIVSLVVILAAGIFAAVTAAGFERTYDGKNDAVDLYLDHENGISDKLTEADGIAEVIVVQNLAREEGMGTMAQNNVAAVVFDYRGFDTLGESFILLTAIAGSFVILSMAKKKKEDDK
ncbi:MAG: hypothetical protein IKM21_05195 [Oscillospiraceae bacterium]|nr:hypothetical protein [Oscillospiraceae bacterium]